MMAQQHLAAAHAQAQVAAAQAHAHALQQQIPPPHPKSDVMTEDKLQEKCKYANKSNFLHYVFEEESGPDYLYKNEMCLWKRAFH